MAPLCPVAASRATANNAAVEMAPRDPRTVSRPMAASRGEVTEPLTAVDAPRAEPLIEADAVNDKTEDTLTRAPARMATLVEPVRVPVVLIRPCTRRPELDNRTVVLVLMSRASALICWFAVEALALWDAMRPTALSTDGVEAARDARLESVPVVLVDPEFTAAFDDELEMIPVLRTDEVPITALVPCDERRPAARIDAASIVVGMDNEDSLASALTRVVVTP